MIFILCRFWGMDRRGQRANSFWVGFKKFYRPRHAPPHPAVRLFVCIGNEFTLAVSCANRHDHCDCDCDCQCGQKGRQCELRWRRKGKRKGEVGKLPLKAKPANAMQRGKNLCIKLSFYCKVLSTKSFCLQKYIHIFHCASMYVCVCLPATCVFSFSVISAELLPPSLTLINIQFLISIKKKKRTRKRETNSKMPAQIVEAKPQAQGL